jgi:hypothetical protein
MAKQLKEVLLTYVSEEVPTENFNGVPSDGRIEVPVRALRNRDLLIIHKVSLTSFVATRANSDAPSFYHPTKGDGELFIVHSGYLFLDSGFEVD